MESLGKRIPQGLLPLLKGIPPITSGLGFGVQGSEFRENNSQCTHYLGGVKATGNREVQVSIKLCLQPKLGCCSGAQFSQLLL